MPEKPLLGYKMHLAVDQCSGLVRRAILTPGHVSDRAPFCRLVEGDERTGGSLSSGRPEAGPGGRQGLRRLLDRQELARRGIADGIMAGDYRQRPLAAAGRARSG
jgi:IS5 family transposase